MNTLSIKAVKTVLLAATVAAGSLAGLALPTLAQAQVLSVQIGPPPPPRYEVVPAARPGWIWAPGHYEWRRGRHVWVSGIWVRERPGYAYVAPVWAQMGERWVYQAPRWDPRPGYGPPPRPGFGPPPPRPGYGPPPPRGMYDRDRDGVPNRYDRRPNDPNRY